MKEFETTIVTRYDGSAHRLLNCRVTIADDRLMVTDRSGAMHQLFFRDITGVDPQTKMFGGRSAVYINGEPESWDINITRKEQRREVASWITEAIASAAR